MIIDIPTAADIPGIAEPWFLAFDANIGFHPTMVPADLEKAGPSIAAAVEAYGSWARIGLVLIAHRSSPLGLF